MDALLDESHLTRALIRITISTNLAEVNALEPNELAHLIVDIISDKKGADIILLDTRAVSTIADYLILATGESERQLKAIAGEIQKQLKQHRVYALGAEGKSESGWVLLDYANVIIHLFSPAMRDYYLLEELHAGAPVVVRMS